MFIKNNRKNTFKKCVRILNKIEKQIKVKFKKKIKYNAT